MKPSVVGDDDTVMSMVLQEQVWIAVVGEYRSPCLLVVLHRPSPRPGLRDRVLVELQLCVLGSGRWMLLQAAGAQHFMNLSASLAPSSARSACGLGYSATVPSEMAGMEREG